MGFVPGERDGISSVLGAVFFLWFWAGFFFGRELGEKNSDYGAKGEHSVVNFVNFVA